MTTLDKIAIYRCNLAKYEAEGLTEKAAIQRRLIARLERDRKPAK